MNKIKMFVYEILRKKPGQRFLHTSLKINKAISNNIFVKVLCIILGILFLLAGIIMLFIPGPGVLFIILGAVLFSVCSQNFAIFLDKTEQRLRAFLNRRA